MAISDKLTYLNETKTQLKDMINYGLDNDNKITNQTTFRNYVSSTFKAFIESLNNPDTLWGNLPKITGEGKEITLNNTIEAPMKLELKPSELEQATTTGKNLLPNTLTSQTYRGLTFTHNEDGSININGTSTAGARIDICSAGELSLKPGTYILSSKNTIPSSTWLTIREGNSDILSMTNLSEKQITISQDTTSALVYFYFNADVTINNLTIYPMVSTSGGDYEPYTGGIASPNPSYPQQIHTISGDNEIVVSNKNLFNKNVEIKNAYPSVTVGSTVSYTNSSATVSYVNGAYLKANTQYTISWTQPTTPSSTSNRIGVIVDSSNKVLETQNTWINSSTSITFTPTNSGYFIVCADKNATNYQLEKGSTPTSYIEHKEQVKHINLGSLEYCEIGDYKDKFLLTSGKNLIPLTTQDFTKNSVRYYAQSGILYLNGTSTGETSSTSDEFKNNFSFTLKAGTYRFSWKYVNGISVSVKKYSDNTNLAQLTQNVSNAGFTLTENTQVYIGFYVYQATTSNTNIELMLEENSSATSYEPYGNGLWYIKKNIGKVVLDGSEDWIGNALNTNTARIDATVLTNAKPIDGNKVITNYFTSIYGDNSDTEHCRNGNASFTTTLICYINKDKINNPSNTTEAANNFKTWLGTHNTIVYYPLATPTYTLLNDTLQTQLEDIYNTMKSYNGQTLISQNNNDLGFNISSSALQDLIG